MGSVYADLYVNGKPEVLNAMAGRNPLRGLRIGCDRNGAFGLDGGIAAVALWEGILPRATRQAVEKELVRSLNISIETSPAINPQIRDEPICCAAS